MGHLAHKAQKVLHNLIRMNRLDLKYEAYPLADALLKLDDYEAKEQRLNDLMTKYDEISIDDAYEDLKRQIMAWNLPDTIIAYKVQPMIAAVKAIDELRKYQATGLSIEDCEKFGRFASVGYDPDAIQKILIERNRNHE